MPFAELWAYFDMGAATDVPERPVMPDWARHRPVLWGALQDFRRTDEPHWGDE